MILDRVTISGADDGVEPQQLIELSQEFPFVEWGILFSHHYRGGVPRFPSRTWVDQLMDSDAEFLASAHLCGAYARSVYVGGALWNEQLRESARLFDRVQLNFYPNGLRGGLATHAENLHAGLDQLEASEFIWQMDGDNDHLFHDVASKYKRVKVVPFFDQSNGRGLEQATWPAPIFPRCGFAGGLRPENVALCLERLARTMDMIYREERWVRPPLRTWIDVETGVRDTGDVFDLDKARIFLEAAKPFVTRDAPLHR